MTKVVVAAVFGCVLLLVKHCQAQDCRSADPSCHTCDMTAGGHTCACDDGFIVTEDGKKCKESKWLGCYTDNPNNRVWKPEIRPQFTGLLTVQICIDACQNSDHTYAGLINQDVCFCGNDHNLELHGKQPSAECSKPCPGNRDETCGANRRLEIYSVCPRGYYDSRLTDCNRQCHCEDDHICSRGGQCPANCAPGWEGEQCQFRDCSYNNGGCEQGCVSERRNNWCSCEAGYAVNPDDSLSCVDINECTNGQNQCQQICINEIGNYSCVCEQGFGLTGRYICEDIIECNLNNGGCGQECINTAGSYVCSCEPGYKLTGVYLCEDVDECSDNSSGCSDICLNQPGSYSCQCNEGNSLVNGSKHLCELTRSPQGDSSTLAAAVGATLGVLVIATIVGAAVIILMKRRRRQRDKDDMDGVDNDVVDSNDVVIHNTDNNCVNTSGSIHVAGAIRECTEESVKSKAIAHVKPLVLDDIDLRDVDRDTRIDHKPAGNKPNPTPPYVHANGESDEAIIYANVNEQPALFRPISLDQLAGEAALITSSKSNLKAEYESIPKKIGCATFALDPGVKPKNRFKDIVPYDHSRVELSKRADEPHSDYINASHIEGYRGRQLIASHGPTKETLNDFWRMIWENDITVVVMVTNPIENGKKKCEVYWGSGGDLTCDEITIHLQSEVVLMDYTIRTLIVTKASCPARSVQQYHYTSWPDHDVPVHGPSLLRLCRRALHGNTGEHPCVVHCSAGVGRTGTLLAVDWLLQEADDTKTVDIPRCVYRLRTQRMNMVQTQMQYEFLYTVLAEGTRVGTTASSREHLQNSLKTDSLRSRAASEFQVLTQHGATRDITKTALLDANRPKNRTDVLPVDQHRVRLISSHPDSNDYINAIFVFGFHRKGEFIATQWPLEGTTVDLWRMVSDYKVNNVVLLDTADDKNGFDSFLPSRESPLDFGKLAVFCEKRTRHTHYLQESLSVKTGPSPTPEASDYTNVAALSDPEAIYMNTTQVTKKAYKQSHGVTMWCVRNSEEVSGRLQQLTAIYRDLSPIIKETGDLKPVLVISRDGCKDCGLYIAMATQLDMLETEGEIDPFYTVQYMKTARPEFFSSQEEYTDLYDCLIQQ